MASAQIDIEEYLSGRLSQETLDRVCSDEHLLKLTEKFSEWINIATYLGLTGVEQTDIEIAWPRNPQRQRIEMFKKWKEKKSDKSNYRSLLHALSQVERLDVCDDLCTLLTEHNQEDNDNVDSPHSSQQLEGVPSLRKLSRLHGLSSKWYILGLQLKVRQDQLDMIEKKHCSNEHLCMVKMFGVWLRECNPSYQKLIKVLIAIGETRVVESLSQNGESSDSDSEHELVEEGESQATENGHQASPSELDNSNQSQQQCKRSGSQERRSPFKKFFKRVKGAFMPTTHRKFSLESPQHKKKQSKPSKRSAHVPKATQHHATPPSSPPAPPLAPPPAPPPPPSDMPKPKKSKSSLPPPPPPPQCVEKYAKYLKQRYKRMSALPNPNWPPSVKEPVKLALIQRQRQQSSQRDGEEEESIKWDYVRGKIDNIVAKKEEIEFEDIFEPIVMGADHEIVPLKILMDGAPGVGKTAITRKACIDWAKGDVLENYHLVVLVPLREAKNRRAKSIEDLLPCDDPELKTQVVKHIQKTSGKHVLLIFDGYDELSAEQRMQESFFLDVINSECLFECTVLVTSRPYASDSLQRLDSVNRHVEILGFTEEQIHSCIRNNIQDETQAENLIAKLQERLDVASLCYIPLNCAIVMHVYAKCDYTLPNSLTSLYSNFILDTLKRHAMIVLKNNQIGKLLCSVSDVSFTSLPKELERHLSSLSKLAYEGMLEDKFLFNYKDLVTAFTSQTSDTLDVESCCLGLLTCVKSFTDNEENTHYQFLHLSLQEFLAARHVAETFTPDQQVHCFLEHLNNVRFRLMLLFLAGLTRLQVPSPELLFQRDMFTNLSAMGAKVEWFLFSAHLIFESRSFDLYTALLENFADKTFFKITNYNLTLFDCMIIAHFLCSTNHAWGTLDLSNTGLNSRSVKVFSEVCCEYECSNSTTFEYVELNSNSSDINLTLGSIPWFSRTKKITFLCNEEQCIMDGDVMTVFRIADQSNCLEDLTLSIYSILSESQHDVFVHDIETMLQNSTSLKRLYIYFEPFSTCINDIAKAIAVGLSANTTLERLNLFTSNHDRVSQLKLKNGRISETATADILSAANSHATLSELCVSSQNLNKRLDTWELPQIFRHTASTFFCALNKSSMTLQTSVFDLSNTNMDTDEAVRVFNTMQKNKEFEEIDMSFNEDMASVSSDSETVGKAAEEMFQDNSVLQTLHLRGCNLHLTFLVYLFRGLAQNAALVNLDVSDNKLKETDTRVTAVLGSEIKQMLQTNTTLKKLQLNGGCIDDCITSYLATGLSQNRSLEMLDLDCNDLSDSTIAEVLSSLTSNISLQLLQVCGVKLSRAQSQCNWEITQIVNKAKMAQFFCALSESSMSIELTEVDLSQCFISSDRTVRVLEVLQSKTTSLKQLDLSGNQDIRKENERVGLAIEQMLIKNSTLISLGLHDGFVDDTIAQHIMSGITENTSLQTLIICNSPLADDVRIELLATIHAKSSICHLHVCGVYLSRQSSKSVWNLEIETVSEIEPFFEALNQTQIQIQMSKLDLSWTHISSNTAVNIFLSLKHNVRLEKFVMSWYNQLTKDDSEMVACALEKMLEANTTLLLLDLHGGSLNSTIAKGIAVGLSKNSSLQSLNIDNNTFNDESTREILTSADSHSTLSSLQLCGVKITRTQGIWDMHVLNKTKQTHFFSALTQSTMHSNVELPKLVLKKTAITSATVVKMLNVLEHNTSLEELDLSENKQISKGNVEPLGIAFEQMLTNNSTLKTLSLRTCDLPTSILIHLFNGLSHNTTLIKLDISENTLSAETATALAEMISRNGCLTELVTEGCWSELLKRDESDSNGGLQVVADALVGNGTLRKMRVRWSEKTRLVRKIEERKKSATVDAKHNLKVVA